MKDLLTIIIPSKNEGKTLYDCLNFLNWQVGIDGVNVIIADISDDIYSVELLYKAKNDFRDKLKIKIIIGGYPSYGRLVGSELAITPYILFLDADILIKDRFLLDTIFKTIENKNIDLLTSHISTDKKWNWVYKIFNVFQKISVLVNSPFAVGGFQLWNRQSYWKVGGYKKDEIFAEDYSISSKVNPKNFYIFSTNKVWTSSRRFDNKGIFYMFNLMIKSYFNRNNPDFFKHHHNYWN